MNFKTLSFFTLTILLLTQWAIPRETRGISRAREIDPLSPVFTAASHASDDERWANIFALSGFDGNVTSLVADGQGNVYAGGEFTAIGGMIVNHVARWDGSTWSRLGDGLAAPVNNLAIDRHGQVYTDILIPKTEGLPETMIVRWNGTFWTALGGDLGLVADTLAVGRESNVVINDLVVDNQDNLYAGGYFYLLNVQEQTERYVGFVATWDGSTWSILGSGMNHTVYSLTVDSSGNVYAGGEFTAAGDIAARRIAKWDGSAWSALGNGLDDTPNVMLVDSHGTLYAAVGALSIVRWDGSSWSMVASKVGGQTPAIFTLAMDNHDNLYAGGWFTSIDGVAASYIGKWDGSTWSPLGSGLNDRVFALTVDAHGNVYAGGFFTNAGGKPANHIAKWDGSSWRVWSAGSGNGTNSTVAALAADLSGNLYAGGYFTTTGSVEANRIARWDGNAWSALGSGMDGWYVGALLVDHRGNLYAGGDFTVAGGVPANRIAMWDGSTWSALGSGMDDQVNALAIDANGILYAAGWFKTAGGVEANGIAKWDGSTWSALGNGATSVDALAIDPSGNLYATGMFFIPPDSDTFTHYIAQWDGSSWNALGSGVNDFVQALAVDSQGNLFAGGNFRVAGGAPASRIARWDGSSWTALGSGIGIEGDYSSISSLAVDRNDDVFVGGSFTLAGLHPSANIARWAPNLETIREPANVTATVSVPAATPVVTAQPTQIVGAIKSGTPPPAFTPVPTATARVALAQSEGRDFRIGIVALGILVFSLACYLLYRSFLRKTKNKV